MSGKVKIVKLRIVYLLKKTPMILGCIAFLSSVCLPFRHFYFVEDRGLYPMDVPIYRVDMWSFKATVYTGFFATQTGARDYWFYENWFYDKVPELRWINTAVLTAQVMTVMFGVISVFINRKVFAFVPPVLCFVIAALMLNVRGTPLWGYYLTVLSVFPFLMAFIIELASSRRSSHT